METKKVSSSEDLALDGLMSWEEFYGVGNEDLVESILSMYDILVGQSAGMKKELPSRKMEFDYIEKNGGKFEGSLVARERVQKDRREWSGIAGENWLCRCSEKSSIEAVTRCAACSGKVTELCSEDVRETEPPSRTDRPANAHPKCRSEPTFSSFREKCELVTCPAGFGTPTTEIRQRLRRPTTPSPPALKRSGSAFACPARPSSLSSIASSFSSSSSSGASSCFEGQRFDVSHDKSSPYLASIESLEDSDAEDPIREDASCRFSKESEEGSEDSGVHSHCASLPRQNRPKFGDPHLSYMDKVVVEIIETEEIYVGDLRKIIQGYLLYWRALPNFPLVDRLDHLFGNIEAIFRFNDLFLKELEHCGLDPVRVAQCFVRNNAGFSVYTEYCTNYPRTVSLLTELMRQEGTVRLFRERQTALQHTLPLGSYLLKPVQRILKYHLLLENIVKQYPKSFEGYKDIEGALRTMTEIAQHINDMKRRHEHEVRVQEIQSLLLGWEGEDLTTFGELCAEGAFRIYGAKAIRHVFLFDKMLLITKKKEGGILGYKTHINCSNLMLIESVPGEPLSFHVIPFDNPKCQYTLQARNLEQKREWTLQLKRVILENYNAVIPSHARQLVMELGQNKSDDDVLTSKNLPKRPHVAPEYLEKRKQDRKKTEFGLKSRIRRNGKLDSGKKYEDQFDKERGSSQKITVNEKKQDMVQFRRKSESDVRSCGEEEPVNESFALRDLSQGNVESPDNAGIKTLEYIVAQILKEKRDFDKLLKRQKRDIVKSGHKLRCRWKTNSETSCEKDNTVNGTLKNEKFTLESEASKNSNEPVSQHELNEDPLRVDGSSWTSVHRLPQKTAVLEEDGIPTSPSVWLRQQDQHLAVPTKKAGSLPRSFQLCSEGSPNDPRALRDPRASLERPFTIASDKLDRQLEEMERYAEGGFFHSNSDITEDGSLTEGLNNTPRTSIDHINVHPEHKIYRSNLSSNVLKTVLSTVHTKLSHLKLDAGPKLELERKTFNKERKASRVIYALAKQYHKALRHKQKSVFRGLTQDERQTTTLPILPVYKQGSSSLGARLANFSETVDRVYRIRPAKKAAAILGVCTNSVVSLPTAADNSGIENETSMSETRQEDSDGFYERTFEAMDGELLEEKNERNEELEWKFENVPPPVPVKPKKELILEKMLEISVGKSARLGEMDIKKEEEDTSSQHSSASTVIEIGGGKQCSDTFTHPSKGWVSHVVGKLQNGF